MTLDLYAGTAKFAIYYGLIGLILGELIDKYILPPVRKAMTTAGLRRDTKFRALVGILLHVTLSAAFAILARMGAQRLSSPEIYAVAAASGGVTLGMAIFFRQDSLKKYMNDLFDDTQWA